MTLVRFVRALPLWLQAVLAIALLLFGALLLLFSQTQDMVVELFRGLGLVWVVVWSIVFVRAWMSRRRNRLLKAFGALLGGVVGVLALLAPRFTAIVIIAFAYYIIAGTAIGVGIVTLYDVLTETAPPPATRKASLIALGILEILVGFFFFLHPILIPSILIPVLGISIMGAGVFVAVVAIRYRLQLKVKPA